MTLESEQKCQIADRTSWILFSLILIGNIYSQASSFSLFCIGFI